MTITIAQAIEQLDRLKPNACPYEDKVEWLSLLDHKIAAELMGRSAAFQGYGPGTPGGTPLMVQGAHRDIYVKYLAAQVDLFHGESARYQDDMTAFNFAWADLARAISRTSNPAPCVRVTKFF